MAKLQAMYTPPHHRQDDPGELFRFMREFPFATLVTSGEDGMTATHLPLTVCCEGGAFRLSGHIARANPQAEHLAAGAEALAIFAAPHAYVSPALYGPGKWVPTWNYVAVHAYGAPAVVESREAKLAVLHEAIAAYDPGYQAEFETFPAEFVDAKLKGIVAFEVAASRVEGRWKLSQERRPVERERIRAALNASGDSLVARLARYMVPPVTVAPREELRRHSALEAKGADFSGARLGHDVGRPQEVAAERLDPQPCAPEPRRQPFDGRPFPDCRLVESRVPGERTGGGAGVGGVDGVLAHDYPQVVLRFGQQAVRVDELVPFGCLQGVPFMDVTVDEDARGVVVRGNAAFGRLDGAGGRLRRTRPTQLLPAPRNEVDEPAAFLRAGRQGRVGDDAPEPLSGRAENLAAGNGREAALAEARPEPLGEHGPAGEVEAQEASAAFAAGKAQHCDFVPCALVWAGDEYLEDGARPVIQAGLRDERLVPALEGTSDGHRPLALQFGDERGKVFQPPLVASGYRVRPDGARNASLRHPG